MNRPIGILDSGIGGVTVLKETIKLLPNQQYIYYSDSINNPYGEKTKDEVFKCVDKIVKFFIDKDCKAIVFACNTATALTINEIRNKYKDIIIVGIEPAYKMIHDFANNKKTLVMATPGTINSEKFINLYNKYDNGNTMLLSCPSLATLIEEGKDEEIKKYLQEKIPKDNFEAVVLGCTHYPLIKKQIEEILGHIEFYDGGYGVALRLKNLLEENNLISDSTYNILFYDSSNNSEKEKRFYKLLN